MKGTDVTEEQAHQPNTEGSYCSKCESVKQPLQVAQASITPGVPANSVTIEGVDEIFRILEISINMANSWTSEAYMEVYQAVGTAKAAIQAREQRLLERVLGQSQWLAYDDSEGEQIEAVPVSAIEKLMREETE